MGVGTQLKKALQERGITIKQLAESIGVPVNTLYSITKRDSMRVNPEIIKQLSDTLGVTPTYLTGFDERIVRPEQYTPEELAEIKAGAWKSFRQSATHLELMDDSETFLRVYNDYLNDHGKREVHKYTEYLITRRENLRPGIAPLEPEIQPED